MPQGSSAVRPTNGLYLYLFTPFKVIAIGNYTLCTAFQPSKHHPEVILCLALSNLATFSIVLTKRTEGFCGILIGFITRI